MRAENQLAFGVRAGARCSPAAPRIAPGTGARRSRRCARRGSCGSARQRRGRLLVWFFSFFRAVQGATGPSGATAGRIAGGQSRRAASARIRRRAGLAAAGCRESARVSANTGSKFSANTVTGVTFPAETVISKRWKMICTQAEADRCVFTKKIRAQCIQSELSNAHKYSFLTWH